MSKDIFIKGGRVKTSFNLKSKIEGANIPDSYLDKRLKGAEGVLVFHVEDDIWGVEHKGGAVAPYKEGEFKSI